LIGGRQWVGVAGEVSWVVCHIGTQVRTLGRPPGRPRYSVGGLRAGGLRARGAAFGFTATAAWSALSCSVIEAR
jgi:hypothetical protein